MAESPLQEHALVQPEAELTSSYGGHSLAFFGLSPENQHYLAPEGIGLVNYRQVNRVAIVLGDPIGPPHKVEQVTRSFLKFCASRHWHVAFYQTGPQYLEIYQSLKLRAFKMGEEGLISPQTFSLKGSALANVRTSCRRAEREGVSIQWYEGVPPEEVLQQLEAVSSAWLQLKGGGQAAETGFTTGKFHELQVNAQRANRLAEVAAPLSTRPLTPRLVTGVVVTSAGKPCAFVTFTPIYGGGQSDDEPAPATPCQLYGWGWALDLMRRIPDAPPGVMELLLVRAIERFREQGAHVVSLGMVAWADSNHEITARHRQLTTFLTDRLGLLENRQTLFNFKQKFSPCWESRYLVTNTPLALPQIALTVMQVRNYTGGWLTQLMKGFLH